MRGHTAADCRLIAIYARIENCCATGKVPFKKRRDAQSEASRLNKLPVFHGPNVWASAYVCNTCGSWHVGRSSR